jgi:hypothetical protein
LMMIDYCSGYSVEGFKRVNLKSWGGIKYSRDLQKKIRLGKLYRTS